MSVSGSFLENALAAAFLASLKTEAVHRTVPRPGKGPHPPGHLARWLERYNRVRRYSHRAYETPVV